MDSYSIIIKPHVTEKTMNLIDKNNEITFVVKRSANKGQIKRAFEELYEENNHEFIDFIQEYCIKDDKDIFEFILNINIII